MNQNEKELPVTELLISIREELVALGATDSEKNAAIERLRPKVYAAHAQGVSAGNRMKLKPTLVEVPSPDCRPSLAAETSTKPDVAMSLFAAIGIFAVGVGLVLLAVFATESLC